MGLAYWSQNSRRGRWTAAWRALADRCAQNDVTIDVLDVLQSKLCRIHQTREDTSETVRRDHGRVAQAALVQFVQEDFQVIDGRGRPGKFRLVRIVHVARDELRDLLETDQGWPLLGDLVDKGLGPGREIVHLHISPEIADRSGDRHLIPGLASRQHRSKFCTDVQVPRHDRHTVRIVDRKW